MTETDNPGLPLPPPVWFGLAVVLAIALEWLAPLHFLALGSNLLFWTGVGCGALAVMLVVWAAGEFRRAGTNVNPARPATQLVASGPFAYLRNPMYVSFLLLLAAFSLAGGLEWGLLLIPLLGLTLHYLVIVREERYLAAKFGEPYDAYRRRVRRWGVF